MLKRHNKATYKRRRRRFLRRIRRLRPGFNKSRSPQFRILRPVRLRSYRRSSFKLLSNSDVLPLHLKSCNTYRTTQYNSVYTLYTQYLTRAFAFIRPKKYCVNKPQTSRFSFYTITNLQRFFFKYRAVISTKRLHRKQFYSAFSKKLILFFRRRLLVNSTLRQLDSRYLQ